MTKKKSIFDKVKDKLADIDDERRKKSIIRAALFAKNNPNCLVMLLDIKTDDMVAAWRDHHLAARLVSPFFHRKTGMVKTILLNREKNSSKRNRYIKNFSDFVAEFLYKMSEHAEEKRLYKLAKEKGFKGTFTDFVQTQRSILKAKKNKVS